MTDNAENTPNEGAAAEKAATGKAARGGGLLAPLGLAAFSLAAAVIVGVMAFPDSDGGGAQEQAPQRSRIILPVPQVLVNLSQSERKDLLQATISVELETDDEAEAQGRFNELLPRVQDQLLKILSALKTDDLDGSTSMESLQTRIMDRLNSELFARGDPRVTSVYFTEFVVE